MLENHVIYLVLWIIDKCIYIGTRKVISTMHLISSTRFFIQFFLIFSFALIRWISLQAILFHGIEATRCRLSDPGPRDWVHDVV
jgi:hypothetical protein